MQLSVNRKLTVTRWIGQETVRVSSSRVSTRGVAYEKASEGAEKSCRVRRRKRGLRKGKKRSRVGKTRSNAPLPPPDSGPSNRMFRMTLRAFDWAEGRAKVVANHIGVLQFGAPVSAYIRQRYDTEKSTVKRVAGEACASHLFGSGLRFFLEKHGKLVPRSRPGARYVLKDMLETRQIDVRGDRVENKRPVREYPPPSAHWSDARAVMASRSGIPRICRHCGNVHVPGTVCTSGRLPVQRRAPRRRGRGR